jgi:hypothetical protein
MSRPPVQAIPVADLRILFNTEVLPKIRRGELMEIIKDDGPPHPRYREPIGTRSQMVEFWATIDGRLMKLALVHRFLRSDGTIGASGQMDPKLVFHEGVVYKIPRKSR